jgi:signal transduction histidine kinase
MRRLPTRLLVISGALVLGFVLIAFFSLDALRRASGFTQSFAARQLDALEKAEQVDELLFQKGFLSNYILTGDETVLEDMNKRKKKSEEWLDQVDDAARTPEERAVAIRLREAYNAYDDARDRILATYRESGQDAAVEQIDVPGMPINGVLAAAHDLTRYHRQELLMTLSRGEEHLLRAQLWVVFFTALTAILGIGLGIWATLRIARPIYELIVQVESAHPERVRVETNAFDSSNEVDTLARHVRGLIGELDEQRRRLVQAEKMEAVGHIAAKLAHEILNPVAGAKVALQAVQRTTDVPDAARKTMQEVDRSLSRIDGILSRLVRYSRPLEPRRQSCRVEELVGRAVEFAGHESAARRVRIRTTVEAVPPVEVDPQLISQVLTNLLVNACQASPPESEIELKAFRKGDSLVFRVSDRGSGLPANRDKLFQPFFTTKENGNGLGLATCQNIVAEHGGQIEASDADGGVGAVFTVSLPQRDGAWRSRS